MIDLEKLVSLAKRRGFFYPGSEIYGGLANTYDYGPLGVELLRNIKNLWWGHFVYEIDNIVGLDASIISSSKVWEASGHTAGFADAMIDCKNCKSRFRADHLVEDYLGKMEGSEILSFTQDWEAGKGAFSDIKDKAQLGKIKDALVSKKVEGISSEALKAIISAIPIPCSSDKCKGHNISLWTDVRKFNLLFPVHLGIIEGDQSLAYLRGETAQGIFINFKNVVDSTRVKLPFGIAQLGKSFRNEITLGNSIFRTIEFEQGEIEYFFDPEKDDWEKIFEDWEKAMFHFVTEFLGINKDSLRWRTHSDEERSFYSKKTEDLEYDFPFGFKELWGLAYRTDYDLKQHSKLSGEELAIQDPQTNKKIQPHVIEPAVGINRLALMVLCNAYSEDDGRVILKLAPKLAPFKVAVFPLLANKPELVKKAKAIYSELKGHWNLLPIAWDDRGNIGKRYLSQDEIGTPYCVTVDFQTLEDDTITIRDRDTAKQERVQAKDLQEIISAKINEG